MVLLRFVPGSICHAPNERPEPVFKAFCSLLAACISTIVEARCRELFQFERELFQFEREYRYRTVKES